MSKINMYDKELTGDEIAAGAHRDMVGKTWDALGRLQFEFLVSRGLRPDHALLDIGCGPLRGGVHFIGYLEPGRYFGVDVNESLLAAGYDVELATAGLQHKLPRDNLLVDGEFQFSRFGRRFDLALAQSLFTHLPLNHIRRCLHELARVMDPGAELYATFYECERLDDLFAEQTHAGGKRSHPDKPFYHYLFRDLEYAADGLPWSVANLGDWNHPYGQRMCRFSRSTRHPGG